MGSGQSEGNDGSSLCRKAGVGGNELWKLKGTNGTVFKEKLELWGRVCFMEEWDV